MWTLQDAKNKFSAVVDAALAGTPQEISRRGRPAVVVVAVERYQQLLEGARLGRSTFVDHLIAFPTEGEGDVVDARTKVVPRDVAF